MQNYNHPKVGNFTQTRDTYRPTNNPKILRIFLQLRYCNLIGHFLTANEIANSYSEIYLECCDKRQERILHRPMQKFNKYTDVFRSFFHFTNLFHKLKYIKYIKNIVDFISVIILA